MRFPIEVGNDEGFRDSRLGSGMMRGVRFQNNNYFYVESCIPQNRNHMLDY